MWWLIPAAIGLAQTGYGIWQQQQADREAKKARESMKEARPGIPKSAEMMVSRAEKMYTEGMDTTRQEEMLGQRTSAAIGGMSRSSMTSSQLMSGITDVYRSELDALNKVAMEAASYRLQTGGEVQRALNVRAGYEAQSDAYPYQEAMMDYQTATQAGSAGTQNIWGGLQTTAGAIMQGGMNQQQTNMRYDIAGVNRPDSWWRSLYYDR